MKWHEHYPSGIPPSFDYLHLPQKHYFNESAQKHPERPFLVYRDTEITFAEVNSAARRMANALLKQGCRKQDCVALIVGNTPEFVISMIACFKIGAIAVPINPRYTSRELERILKDCQADIIVILEKCLKNASDLFSEGKTSVKRIIVAQSEQGERGDQGEQSEQDYEQGEQVEHDCGQNEQGDNDFEQAEKHPLHYHASAAPSLSSFETVLSESEDKEPDIDVHPNDCAVLLYTGGTTGLPKGCTISHGNLEASARIWASWYTYPLEADEYPVILCPVPMYHIYGLVGNIGLATLNAGTILLVESLSFDEVLPIMVKYSPNLFCIVPSILIALLHHPEFKNVNPGNIKVVGVGGDSLPEAAKQEFENLTGLCVTIGYGLTETSGSVIGQPHTRKSKEGSAGLPLPDVELRIVSLEDPSQEVAPGESGELVIKGPTIISTYWNQPEETENAIRNGWLFTGDIACMDEEGWVFIKERKKDLIITNGFNVYPKEIDEVLHSHPRIKEACTIGVPDPERGEMVKSYIVIKQGKDVRPEEIVAYCREYLAGYKVPKAIEFIEALPKTVVGKPSRLALRSLALG